MSNVTGEITNDIMVCSNIGRGQRRLRYMSALVCAVIGIAVALLLVATGASRWWRLALAPLIWIGCYGYLEAVNRTCVALASRDEQSLEDDFAINRALHGDKIQDNTLKRALREKARKITQQVIVITAVAMAVILLIP